MYVKNESGPGEDKKPARRPTLYVHAGLPKTGTTSIQMFLGNVRELLKDRGILYPETGIYGSGHVKFAIPFLNRDYFLRMRKSNLLCEGENAGQIKRHLEEEIAASDTCIESVIISAESFDGVDEKGLARLLGFFQPDFRIKAIIYLRRQDKYAESLHAQAYRVREMAFDRDQLLARGHFRYDHYVDLWASSLGSDNLVLREYPESAPAGQLIQDFLNAVGVNCLPVDSQKLRLNARLDRLALEYIRHHTRLRFGSDVYFKVVQLLSKFGQAHPVEERYRYFYSPEEQQSILDDCKEANARLSESYFDGGLFRCVPSPCLITDWEPFTGLSETQIELMDSYLLRHGVPTKGIGRH